ncbi:3-hydroxyacyl-CoA dehydrogenase NAD-binding domain-containing protein [Amycolatopsis nalaikhensis]|uniref:3-hydroxyacyl-CoA dehydrogenase NAD-binding domain-containing protein n=1 Tax=Amycolatopsis nalaikhensis TaxID=715472 RepID=A0ABY8X943_9PSEU|nr:3-hydroxyacyl-CoA dehydrogenase NAD-binding domain-containing protein [Amycolatopsis sp. 2-2]WIV52919.1 3-hydroxyacyl-CoA dehydrogenase NAD-binding domain-containing protein [Amycolatopsis sp. 2-2]
MGALDRAVAKNRLTAQVRDETVDRLTFTTDLDALAEADLVVEAVAEDEQAKVEVFTAVEKVVRRPDAILASNTSSIRDHEAGDGDHRPAQVVGIHFFNPVPVLPLVEIVPSLLTSPRTLDRAAEFTVGTLGKQVIHAKDRAGLVGDYLQAMADRPLHLATRIPRLSGLPPVSPPRTVGGKRYGEYRLGVNAQVVACLRQPAGGM